MEKINWICKSDTINNTIVWSCHPKSKENFDSIENFESSSDKMIGVKVSLKNVSTGGVLADGSEGTIIKVATDSQPYLIARIDTPDVIWWYKQDELKFPSSETLLCLSELNSADRNPNSPGCLMTMNGTDWYVPNISGKIGKNRVTIAKLNDTYYMACMYEPNMLYSSKDARNWQPVVKDIFKDVSAMGIITFKNKLYIGVYDRGFYSSSDGDNWTRYDIYASHLAEMTIINDKLYLINRYHINQFDETTNTSKNISPSFRGGNGGMNWLRYDPDTKTYLVACYGEGGKGPEREKFYWSNDLVNWTPSGGNYTATGHAQFTQVAKAFGKWWSNGHYASLLVCSEDGGKTWNEVKPPATTHASLFKMGEFLFYMGVDDPPNQFFSTKDGKNWEKVVTANVVAKGGAYWKVSVI